MKYIPCFAAVLVLFSFALSGCSTTDSRIQDHQAAFDAAPPAVQAKIRAGKVEGGFTQEQVLMAVGEPDRKYTRTTAAGTSIIWAYADHKPTVSVGFGMVSGGGGTMIGSGVAMTAGGDRYDDVLRVVLSGDHVVAVETSSRS